MNKRNLIKENSITEGTVGGTGVKKSMPLPPKSPAAPSIPVPVPAAKAPPLPTKAVPPPPTETQEAGDQFDEFGYEIAPKTPEPGEEDKTPAKKATPPPPEEIKDPATGYGVKPPPAAKEEPVVPAEVKKVDLGYELEVKELDPTEALKIKEFAKLHSLSQEAAQALVNQKTTEIKEQTAAFEAQEKANQKANADMRAKWDKELREDPTFGGENFAHNLGRVEKVLAEFMPETKKALTERKSMLPPYVVRDMAKIADHLYGTESLTLGEAQTPEESIETNEDDHLSFYTQGAKV